MTVDEQIADYRAQIIRMMRKVATFGMEEYRDENEEIQKGICDLGDILRAIAGFRARAQYLRAFISDSRDSRFTRLKVELIDPFLEELTEQFKIWSRVIAVQELDWNISRG